MKLNAQKKKEAEKAKVGAPANADRFYVTNKELIDEMIKWRDSNKDPEKRIISNRFGEMMLAISSKVLNRSEFRNYPKEVKEDMASFGHYKLLKGIKNYDFKFTNVFSYVTQCYWNAYLSVLKKHYKHINIKKAMMEKYLSEMQTFPGMNAASSLGKCIKAYIDDGCNNSPSEA